MKTFYSSTFLTLILAFLILLGKNGHPVVISQDTPKPFFQTILSPVGPSLEPPSPASPKIEVFNGFNCPGCIAFGQNTLPELVKKYTNSSNTDFHLYLIPQTGDDGQRHAVRGVHCAAKYGRFWDMVSELYKTDSLTRRNVDLSGQKLELPVTDFRKCLNAEDFDARIEADVTYSQSRKVLHLPMIFVNDTMLLGNQPIENIEYIIKKNM